ncbi:MAG: acyltransferase [Candidatus Promineifilaceae bacterium]
MTLPVARTAQRYLIPRFAISLYYYLRDGCLISTQARVQLNKAISFGKGSVVKPFAVIQSQSGRIAFGRQCAVSSFCHISTGTQDVIIGDFVRLANSVTILGGSRNYHRRELLIIEQGSHNLGATIGGDVLAGSGAVILPGCQIGRGAVIGANCVVTGDVPEYAIVAGVPGKVIGYRE